MRKHEKPPRWFLPIVIMIGPILIAALAGLIAIL